jgi:hypothetical protein
MLLKNDDLLHELRRHLDLLCEVILVLKRLSGAGPKLVLVKAV